MIGRRAAVWLCVLVTHALLLFALLRVGAEPERLDEPVTFFSEPITLDIALPDEELPPPPDPVIDVSPPPAIEAPAAIAAPAVPAAAPVVAKPRERVDWPIEAKKSATRVLAAEAEAERIARMFSGPGGTWASLTKRERSRVRKFRWKPGVDGLEFDDKGNAIYHISDGCVLVNLSFIACKLGKEKIHGELFKDMQQYFDEQRLPETDDGNGTEPEALRPAN